MSFEHLRSVKKGDRDWIVPVSLHDYTPPKQRGFVPDGRYAAKIVDAEGIPSEKGNGVNLRMMLRIESPGEYAGVEIEEWMYVSFTDEQGYGYKSYQHLLYSVASATPGKAEALMQMGADGKPQRIGVGPALLINKACFVETQRGEKDAVMKDGKVRDFSDSSKIKYFISRESFEKQPGPAPVGSSLGGAQKSQPELSGRSGASGSAAQGNGTGSATPIGQSKSKVDDLVDF